MKELQGMLAGAALFAVLSYPSDVPTAPYHRVFEDVVQRPVAVSLEGADGSKDRQGNWNPYAVLDPSQVEGN